MLVHVSSGLLNYINYYNFWFDYCISKCLKYNVVNKWNLVVNVTDADWIPVIRFLGKVRWIVIPSVIVVELLRPETSKVILYELQQVESCLLSSYRATVLPGDQRARPERQQPEHRGRWVLTDRASRGGSGHRGEELQGSVHDMESTATGDEDQIPAWDPAVRGEVSELSNTCISI